MYPGFLAVSQYCDLVGESGPGLPYRVGNDPHLHPDFWKMQMGGMSALPCAPAKPVGLKRGHRDLFAEVVKNVAGKRRLRQECDANVQRCAPRCRSPRGDRAAADSNPSFTGAPG